MIKDLIQINLFYLGHLSLMLAIYLYSKECTNPKLATCLRLIPIFSLAVSGLCMFLFAMRA